MLDQDNKFYLISMSILITCWLDNLWRSYITVIHLWELKGKIAE